MVEKITLQKTEDNEIQQQDINPVNVSARKGERYAWLFNCYEKERRQNVRIYMRAFQCKSMSRENKFWKRSRCPLCSQFIKKEKELKQQEIRELSEVTVSLLRIRFMMQDQKHQFAPWWKISAEHKGLIIDSRVTSHDSDEQDPQYEQQPVRTALKELRLLTTDQNKKHRR